MQTGTKGMTRFLYVMSTGESVRSERVFACVRHDMATATVVVTFDRRRGDRRNHAENVPAERRQGDRRRHSVDEELARVGWARVQIEQPPNVGWSATGRPPPQGSAPAAES